MNRRGLFSFLLSAPLAVAALTTKSQEPMEEIVGPEGIVRLYVCSAGNSTNSKAAIIPLGV